MATPVLVRLLAGFWMGTWTTVRSEPAVAHVRGECLAHGSGSDLRLELGDELGVPLRLTVHRVLQPLDELLEVRDSRFEGL